MAAAPPPPSSPPPPPAPASPAATAVGGRATRLGILGGGQLGMMLAEAAVARGIACVVVDHAADVPAARVAEVMTGDTEDQALLEAFAARVDRVTYEFENVPVEAAAWLAERLPVWPPVEALRVSQERIAEKTFLAACGMEVAAWRAVATRADLVGGWEAFGRRAVLKTRRFGYDGKGQQVIRSEAELALAWERLRGRPLILEAFVDFAREVSLVAARDEAGRVVALPLAANHHDDGILRWTIAPAPDLPAGVHDAAGRHAAALLERLGYVGVATLEFFLTHDGRLVANEMAPRVHNSGHWTIEGATPSQFELHVRAVCGEAIEPPRLVRPALGAMPEGPSLHTAATTATPHHTTPPASPPPDHRSGTPRPSDSRPSGAAPVTPLDAAAPPAAPKRDDSPQPAPASIAPPAAAYLMVNLIGELPHADVVARLRGACWHLYGKTPRPGRKLGHVVLPWSPEGGPDPAALAADLAAPAPRR